MADLKKAVGTVLEGWTLPHDVRKILETAYYADTHAPVQAEQSLEVVAEVTRNHAGQAFILGGGGNCFDVSKFVGVKFTDHAKATAALAQKDAEIARLILESAKMLTTSQREGERLIVENNTLRAQLAEAEKDALNWRQYQARKQAIIAAGMGKNPLRDAALSNHDANSDSTR